MVSAPPVCLTVTDSLIQRTTVTFRSTVPLVSFRVAGMVGTGVGVGAGAAAAAGVGSGVVAAGAAVVGVGAGASANSNGTRLTVTSTRRNGLALMEGESDPRRPIVNTNAAAALGYPPLYTFLPPADVAPRSRRGHAPSSKLLALGRLTEPANEAGRSAGGARGLTA